MPHCLPQAQQSHQGIRESKGGASKETPISQNWACLSTPSVLSTNASSGEQCGLRANEGVGPEPRAWALGWSHSLSRRLGRLLSHHTPVQSPEQQLLLLDLSPDSSSTF